MPAAMDCQTTLAGFPGRMTIHEVLLDLFYPQAQHPRRGV
jgi:hypothetical protein